MVELTEHINTVIKAMGEEKLLNGYNPFLFLNSQAAALRTTIRQILQYDSETYHK